MASRDSRLRLVRAAVAAGVIVIGLAVRAYLDGAAAKYGGVALYAVLVYVLVSIVWVRARPARVFAAALAICVAIELFQLTPIPTRLAEIHRGFALVLGTTFHWWDLLAYAGGCGAAAVMHGAVARDKSPER